MRWDTRTEAGRAAQKLYKSKRWKALRAVQLKRRPICERCIRRGKVVPANVVNHKTPHKGDPALMFDATNLESVCKPCHDGAIQSEERRGYSTEIGPDGWPVDPNHPARR